MAGGADFLPPFSFWAAIISCLLISASSILLFLLSLLPGQLFLLFCSDLLPLGLLLLQPLQFSLLLGPLISPLVDVLLQLFVELVLLNSSLALSKGFISFHRSLRGVGQPLIFVVRHVGCL